MAGRHQVGVATDLAVLDVAARDSAGRGAVAATFCPLRSVFGRRRGGVGHFVAERPVRRGAERHVVHAATHLGFAKLLLEELQVPAAVAHLRVESGSDGLVVGLRSHGIGSIEESLLALNLLEDVLDSVFFVHVGRWGCATPRAGAASDVVRTLTEVGG